MKIQIILVGAPFMITTELPTDTNFVAWCKYIKADGAIFSDQMHIPYDKIIGVGIVDESGAVPAFIVPGATAPGTETKQ